MGMVQKKLKKCALIKRAFSNLTFSVLPTSLNWMMITGLMLSLTGVFRLQYKIQPSDRDEPRLGVAPPRTAPHLYWSSAVRRALENIVWLLPSRAKMAMFKLRKQLRTSGSQVNTQTTQVRSGQGGEQVSKVTNA